MKKNALVLVSVMSGFLAFGSISNAAIIMDSANHNGDLTAAAVGFWSSTPGSVPTGWVETAANNYTTTVGWIQAGSQAEGTNNTGEMVSLSEAFTVSSLMKGDSDPTVRVFATQNIDGTGIKALLASVNQPNGSASTWVNEVGVQGAPAAASLTGYYVQVVFGGPWSLGNHYIAGDYDSIVVTSEIVPEPATIALLSLGGLFLRKRKSNA